MTSVLSRLACALLLLLAAAPVPARAAGPTGAPPAAGRPAPPQVSRDAAGRWRLPLERAGLGPEVRLAGPDGTAELELPVPPGMRASAVTARMQLPADLERGTIEVRAGSRRLTLARLRGPDRNLTLPLGGLAGGPDGRVAVTLAVRLDTADDICAQTVAGTAVVLAAPALLLTGTPVRPSTVAGFWPPALTELTVLVGAEPSIAAREAVLDLAGALAARYQGQRPVVRVRRAPRGRPPVAARPFAATVTVRDTGRARIGLVPGTTGVALDVAGPAGQLPALALEAASASTLVTEREAAPSGPVAPESREAGPALSTRRSLAALGVTRLTASGAGRLRIPIAFSQAQLGGPAEIVQVRLLGTHTPVPTAASASLAVLADGVQQLTTALTDSGQLDATVELGLGQLHRDTLVEARVDYAPPSGRCARGFAPMTVQLSPASYVEREPGQSLGPGFGRFPQALGERVPVAVGPDPVALELAANLAAELVRMGGTGAPSRRFGVVTAAGLATGRDTGIAVGSAPVLASLGVPVRLDGGKLTLTIPPPGQAGLAGVRLSGSPGLLFATGQGGRDLLVAAGPRGRLAQLTESLRSQADGLAALTGDLVVLPGSGRPVGLDLYGTDPVAEPGGDERSGPRWTAIAMLALASAALVGVVALIGALWRRRRRAG